METFLHTKYWYIHYLQITGLMQVHKLDDHDILDLFMMLTNSMEDESFTVMSDMEIP